MRWKAFVVAALASAATGAGAAALNLHAPRAGVDKNGPVVCEPVTFSLYFEQDRAKLTEPAERMLDLVGGHVRGCTIQSIGIETPANQAVTREGRQLAGARGAEILRALSARGLNPDTVRVALSGEPNEPAAATPPRVTVAIGASLQAPLSADNLGSHDKGEFSTAAFAAAAL